MNETLGMKSGPVRHEHVFLGAEHASRERRTWFVIALCALTMLAEIAGGWRFGSLALVADGLHMSTHAGAMLIAALAYTYARRHAHDSRFSFGTGKLGDLAGFTSAVALALIAVLIGYEAVTRLVEPVPIRFGEAIPIAVFGLAVNLSCAWLLGGAHHGHAHGGHDHHDGHDHAPERHQADAAHRHDHADAAAHHGAHGQQAFHARDHNFRAAYLHVIGDAVVSVLAIAGLIAARAFGWNWMDPLAGIVGALVIANWSFVLIRDTGATLLDMTPDPALAARIRERIEGDGDAVVDLHLWRLGPGHLSAALSVATGSASRDARFYHQRLAGVDGLSHLTVEVMPAAAPRS
ncbi:CDF family Co(II)/Ni(II) efflux transporter DmeF [Burkholderia glumae]|uniref:CDF family Co(II)/Ni(II) efflux transporter DmeF n=1 Tax=Burkholderia glumae TaxID=337 RepID=A0AAP9XY40_BURGL|nr:CDF family Co(II)/Ni(II) efflux transporter DmeF [Burkholderia glumae]ACR30808.1 Cation diffusion facilitator family transporter [Burkholderia glumae BGR1]AJY64750.1 cation diffusion facilitator transporter family protein [Burkholderia glumae LMG 2196 = ATCC 33617]KHJ60170.1 cation transporter [Burkholderia glumae]MCM2483883.1 CDF family Co(II)/Ni(II) efflux transporter DmeF [Burkholderia glumae]MCM2509577.1 CDF family Co(II)/Ni(II) efflux transporter DmeF [Burkholderia glumae]